MHRHHAAPVVHPPGGGSEPRYLGARPQSFDERTEGGRIVPFPIPLPEPTLRPAERARQDTFDAGAVLSKNRGTLDDYTNTVDPRLYLGGLPVPSRVPAGGLPTALTAADWCLSPAQVNFMDATYGIPIATLREMARSGSCKEHLLAAQKEDPVCGVFNYFKLVGAYKYNNGGVMPAFHAPGRSPTDFIYPMSPAGLKAFLAKKNPAAWGGV